MDYWENNTSKSIIMIAVYALQTALIFTKDTCKLAFGHIMDKSPLENWLSCHSFRFGFFGWFLATFEVFEDIYTMVKLWKDMNYLYAAYFVGKMPINASFYLIGIVASFLSVKNAKLETRQENDPSGDEIVAF